MKKMKLLTAILFCLGIAGMASAVEVINIDLNKQGNEAAYSGPGAYEATNIWRVYSEGWGKAMGSPRSADLADYDEPNEISTYAAQVWIGADMNNSTTYGPCDVTLMDDGFANTGGPADPNPTIRLWGIDAYGGIDPNFDIYVYGANDGNFTLTCPLRTPTVEVNHVDGWSLPGYVPGKNYVVFRSVPISSDSNYVTLSYDNVLNGLQIVKLKYPKVIGAAGDPTYINAQEYDVAYESNRRVGEPLHFGPDLGAIYDPWDDANIPCVTYLDAGEYMEYDIEVKDGNEGWYEVSAEVDVNLAPASFDISLIYGGNNTEVPLGTIGHAQDATQDRRFKPTDDPASVAFNLFAGTHSIKWRVTSDIYVNISRLKVDRIGDLQNVDCDEARKYGWNIPYDFDGDCHVDFKDLAYIITEADWLSCYDPNENNCP
jgi:hypothetical protein